MDSHSKQLPIPEAVLHDDKAIELARVWAARGGQHVSLATGVWVDAANWGIFLVDLAKHVANAYEQTTGQDRNAILQRIREGFDAEWSAETDQPTGNIMD